MMAPDMQSIDRRRVLAAGASVAALTATAGEAAAQARSGGRSNRAGIRSFDLEAVRLKPSIYLDAVEANRSYLHRLEPDRLLHNFRTSAGLDAKGEVYGGWEGDTIAGHTLGHYLTALGLMYAQTGDPECRRRTDYIVDELAECQAAHGDGYVAGFTRKRPDGTIVDGKEIFPEIMAGDIRSAGFDLNGCWVPFYNWHKLFAGLFHAQDHCGNAKALPIAIGLAQYIERVFAVLDEVQTQKVLDCEFGGMNETFAELYARTRDGRWLTLANRFWHNRIMDPLAAGEDRLANNHANTQVPKLIGSARMHEVAPSERDAAASQFFWDTVTQNHTYVIGGNADREYFQQPRSIARHITEQTCEACNTYNMLKLTRHLYQRDSKASYFDYFERAHLNHIMAHQNPRTGMFTYMTPLMSGTRRGFSQPFDSFWCCLGSGIESHSKHGESVWWRRGDDLIVNLYIPSTLTWRERGAQLSLDTAMPFDDRVTVTIDALRRPATFAASFRLPAWTTEPTLTVNGQPAEFATEDGYAVIRRRWRAGDKVELTLPRTLVAEPTPGDDGVIALVHGPVVLAADLGTEDRDLLEAAPVLVGQDLLARFRPTGEPSTFRTEGIGRPGDMTFRPFFAQYERRTAVYFKRFTDAQWETEKAALAAEEARRRAIDARSVDVMHLGEMQPERDHQLESAISYPVVYRGRQGRDARSGGFFQFRAKSSDKPLVLQATYWGGERVRRFHILVDGQRFATETLENAPPSGFYEKEYAIPPELTRGKETILIRFEPERGSTAGPVFGCRLLTAETAA